jgi:branched-subunit amino acid transport protein AzlD
VLEAFLSVLPALVAIFLTMIVPFIILSVPWKKRRG